SAAPADAANKTTQSTASKKAKPSQVLKPARYSDRVTGRESRQQAAKRRDDAGKAMFKPGTSASALPVAAGGRRQRSWSTETNRPWSFYNRGQKTVKKRGAKGRSVSFKSAKPAKRDSLDSRNSVASERLGRLTRSPSLSSNASQSGPNTAAEVINIRAAISRPRNIQELSPPVPKAERQKAKTTVFGRVRAFFSAKKT
ncbi:MAG: hypothetical protein AAF337_14755, partial [Pseudomonadota bacterium]